MGKMRYFKHKNGYYLQTDSEMKNDWIEVTKKEYKKYWIARDNILDRGTHFKKPELKQQSINPEFLIGGIL